MIELTVKERFAFRFVFNEKRVYQRWYGRFLMFGLDYGRLRRVVARVGDWRQWCQVWTKEGDEVYRKAELALAEGSLGTAKALFHQAVACYHAGQHIFFIDSGQKEATQDKARKSYVRALSLYSEAEKPVRVDIPYRGVSIPGYFRKAGTEGRPLIIFVNGMDNIKEAEGHHFSEVFYRQGFNFFTFDGPGQGEMWRTMKFDAHDYHSAVSAVIDWFEQQPSCGIDLERIGLVGFSLGGYLAPEAAARDPRVKCTAGNSGLVYIGGIQGLRKLNPIWQRGVTYMTGVKTLEEALSQFNYDIADAPALRSPLLFFHAGRDEVMPKPKIHADVMVNWAKGETTLRYMEDAEHCTMNYLDEVFPEILDWFKKQLRM